MCKCKKGLELLLGNYDKFSHLKNMKNLSKNDLWGFKIFILSTQMETLKKFKHTSKIEIRIIINLAALALFEYSLDITT